MTTALHEPALQHAPPDVADCRARFRAAIAASNPPPAARQWRLGRFERGLRLADELERRVGPLAGTRVLDIGAAHGGDCAALCARGASCVGLDKFDYDYAALVNRLAVGDRLRFEVTDCTARWPFTDAAFDVVIAMAVIEHVDDLDLFFAETRRVLRAGGVALIETAPVLRNAVRDNLYGLPLIALLPTPARHFVAERLLRRHYEFHVSQHSFYSASKLKRLARRHGLQAQPCKYADSRLAARVWRWPLGRLWQRVLCHWAFDFLELRT